MVLKHFDRLHETRLGDIDMKVAIRHRETNGGDAAPMRHVGDLCTARMFLQKRGSASVRCAFRVEQFFVEFRARRGRVVDAKRAAVAHRTNEYALDERLDYATKDQRQEEFASQQILWLLSTLIVVDKAHALLSVLFQSARH